MTPKRCPYCCGTGRITIDGSHSYPCQDCKDDFGCGRDAFDAACGWGEGGELSSVVDAAHNPRRGPGVEILLVEAGPTAASRQ